MNAIVLNAFWILPVLVFFAALICEFIDSHLGGGYGTILTPFFLVLGIPQLIIVHSILYTEIVTGFEAGAIYHSFKGIDYKSVLALTVTAGIGSVIGTFVSVGATAFLIKMYIGGLVLILGVVMFLNLKVKQHKTKYSGFIGGLIGFNKAITGGGFGPVAVAGLNISGITAKKCIGTTLLAEGVTCTVSLVLYYLLGTLTTVLEFMVPLMAGAIIGSYLGSKKTKDADSNKLRRNVGITITVLGAIVLIQTLVI
jgi:uncharacterized membrane protein YfcA